MGAAGGGALGRAVDGVLACANAEERIELGMECVAASVQGIAAGVTIWRRGAFVTQSWAGLPPTFQHDYVARFASEDPWARAGLHGALGTPFTSDELVPRSRLEKSAFHRELCHPHGVRDLCGGVLVREQDFVVTFGLLRAADARGDGTRETASLAALVPALTCLARAELTNRRLAVTRAAVDTVPFGVLSVDVAKGVLLGVNTAGQRLIERGLVSCIGAPLVVDGESFSALVRRTQTVARRTTRARGVRVLIQRTTGADEHFACIVHVHHDASTATSERSERRCCSV